MSQTIIDYNAADYVPPSSPSSLTIMNRYGCVTSADVISRGGIVQFRNATLSSYPGWSQNTILELVIYIKQYKTILIFHQGVFQILACQDDGVPCDGPIPQRQIGSFNYKKCHFIVSSEAIPIPTLEAIFMGVSDIVGVFNGTLELNTLLETARYRSY